jgi:hypothetical protein
MSSPLGSRMSQISKIETLFRCAIHSISSISANLFVDCLRASVSPNELECSNVRVLNTYLLNGLYFRDSYARAHFGL